jgi:hypothetical protein
MREFLIKIGEAMFTILWPIFHEETIVMFVGGIVFVLPIFVIVMKCDTPRFRHLVMLSFIGCMLAAALVMTGITAYWQMKYQDCIEEEHSVQTAHHTASAKFITCRYKDVDTGQYSEWFPPRVVGPK